ncbi:hypothetical protein TrVFT333_007671 [Trichoderma virens FT-333]|nr:hypothetical protein TrVFT333_007671 [Trichoderma virens FT-333]
MGLGSQTSDEDVDAVFIGRDDVSDYNPEQLLPQPAEVIEKIRSWLQPTAYDIAGGIPQAPKDEHGLLWIKGIPGSGKSVMAASIIDEIAKSNPGTPVLYFFFRQIIDANHEPRALLRDWMDQILSYSPPLQKQLKAYVDAHRSLESISSETMWNQLRLAFASLPGKVFCVADALDEMDRGNEEFLRTLGEIGQWRPKTVKILITSRPVASVEIPLRKTPCLHIRLQEALVDMDISTYVHFALSRSNIPESDWQVIADAVPGRANGLFLYAKLAMDAFLEPNVDINAVLLKLPTDLNALYTDLLSEHAKRSGVPDSIQHLILQSVTHATRPLRLLELAEMIRVSFSEDSERDIKSTKELIRAACGPLLEILPDETVSVIHHSFTEYLKGSTRLDEGQQTGYPVLQMGPTHAQLALQCILYLKSGCLASVGFETDENMDDMPYRNWYFGGGRGKYKRRIKDVEIQIRFQYPFFEYAASNWYQHIVKSEAAGQDQTEINAKLNELFELDNNMEAWLQMRWPESSLGARNVTKLHIAAKAGLVSYVKELLGSFDINVPDIYNRTPLWWAASEGHAEILSTLIEGGADLDRPDSYTGVKPLHVAASNEHPAAIAALLKAGVNPLTEKTLEDPWVRCGNIPSTIGNTPLMYACDGHLDALEAFLPFIRDDLDLMHRSIAWAASSGSSNCVDMLLQQPGVDINATVDGQTPLYRACETALHTASRCPVLIKLLLEAGLDANATDIDGATPLHSIRAAMESVSSSIALLVEQGHADVNAAKENGETPLHGLISRADPTTAMRFLEYGPNCNAVDNKGNTPLHILMQHQGQNTELVKALLDRGADPNARNHSGLTPLLLWGQVSGNRTATLDVFLASGADINAVDNDGNNLIFRSLSPFLFMNEEDPHRDIKCLIDRGLSPFQRNFQGETALHHAVTHPYAYESRTVTCGELYAKKLIDAGANPLVYTHEGLTPLHLAARCRASNNVGLLLDALRKRQQNVPNVDDSTIQPGNPNGATLDKNAIKRRAIMGVDAKATRDHFADTETPLYYASSIETEARLAEGEWHAFGDKLKPGLFFSKSNDPLSYVKPLIVTAVQRELPNMDMVRLLVEKYAVNINEADNSMESALFYVVRGNHWWQVHQALPYLLDAGADIHMRNAVGQTPLHMALEADDNRPGPFNWDAAKILIERGADVNAIDGKGQSCLASARHNVDMINFLIKHGATVTVNSVFGAIDSGNVQVLQALLSSGIDPNTRRDKPLEESGEKNIKKDEVEAHEEFPLHYAAMKLSMPWDPSESYYQEIAVRMEIIRTLVQYGANPFAKFLKWDTGTVVEPDSPELQVTTIEVPKGYRECTVIHEALHLDIIADAFLQLPNLDVNHRDTKGRTLLHMICENKGGPDGGGPDHIIGSCVKDGGTSLEERVSSFQQLLSLGAELEATDNFGQNVVHYMLAGRVHSYFTTYKKFLAYAIEKAPSLLNQADGNGDTPFHYAVRRATDEHTTDDLEMVLAAGADPTVVNKKGETLLHILAQSISIAALRNFFQVLVDRGIDINARNNRGETALFSFYSCPKTESWFYYSDEDRPSAELVKPMLEALGGDFFARDNKGRGLLHAAAAGDVERFQELRDMGLDPMMEDNAQQTAIDAAAACGNRAILELFEKKE